MSTATEAPPHRAVYVADGVRCYIDRTWFYVDEIEACLAEPEACEVDGVVCRVE